MVNTVSSDDLVTVTYCYQWCYITVIPNILCYITNAIPNVMYVKLGKLIWIYKLIIWHLLASSASADTELTNTVYWCMPSKWKASQNLFLNKNDPFLHGSDCNFCNTINYLHFMFIIYVWCICVIQEYWWMTVHESVMEIQIWSIISSNWNMNLYELPMILWYSQIHIQWLPWLNDGMENHSLLNQANPLFKLWISHLWTNSSIFHQLNFEDPVLQISVICNSVMHIRIIIHWYEFP